jgi:hypothetical protein
MTDTRRLPQLALLALGMALASCGPPPATPPRSLDAATLVAELRARQARVRSLRGETKMDYRSSDGRTKVTINLAVARPGKLRFEAENPITGHTEGTLVTLGPRFALLDVRHGQFLHGPAMPCNVARLLRVAMPPEDVVDILLGSAPLGTFERAEVGWRRDGGGREILTLHLLRDWTERIEVDPRTRDVVAAELQVGKVVVWRLTHEGFRDVRGVRLPRKTHVVESRSASDVVIRYKDVEVNVEIPEVVFQLTPPRGVMTQAVVCTPDSTPIPRP